jgi:hypothetical protein
MLSFRVLLARVGVYAYDPVCSLPYGGPITGLRPWNAGECRIRIRARKKPHGYFVVSGNTGIRVARNVPQFHMVLAETFRGRGRIPQVLLLLLLLLLYGLFAVRMHGTSARNQSVKFLA